MVNNQYGTIQNDKGKQIELKNILIDVDATEEKISRIDWENDGYTLFSIFLKEPRRKEMGAGQKALLLASQLNLQNATLRTENVCQKELEAKRQRIKELEDGR